MIRNRPNPYNTVGIPEDYLCSITHELMEEPIVAADGFSYEEVAIRQWIALGHQTSPKTGARLDHTTLIPNLTLRTIIHNFKEELPKIQQKKLTERDLEVAIRLREEEVQAMLEKHGQQLAVVEAEHNGIVQQLGPMEQEIVRLRKENQELKEQVAGTQRLLANAVLDDRNKVDLPIDDTLRQHLLHISQLEAEMAELRKYKAANLIKWGIGYLGIRKFLNSSRLQEAREGLLHKREVIKDSFKMENAEMQKQMERLVRQQNWDILTQLTTQAQAREAKFIEQNQALEPQIFDLSQAKIWKRREIERRADRLARINEQVVMQRERIMGHIEEQKKQAENLIYHLQQRHQSIAQRSQTFFQRVPKLQDLLVDACERGELTEVQKLIRQGADPNILSSDGKHPFGAAIWGLNMDLVQYLETVTQINRDDFVRIMDINQAKYGQIPDLVSKSSATTSVTMMRDHTTFNLPPGFTSRWLFDSWMYSLSPKVDNGVYRGRITTETLQVNLGRPERWHKSVTRRSPRSSGSSSNPVSPWPDVQLNYYRSVQQRMRDYITQRLGQEYGQKAQCQ